MVDKEEDKKKNCQIFRDGLTVRGGGSGLCRRLADVGAPRVIQVQHAFALTSVVLLARRRGAKSICCAYEHESKRTPSVPDPLKSNVTLFEGGEIVKQAFRQDTIEHGDYSTQPQMLEKNACGVVTEHMIGVLVQLHG